MSDFLARFHESLEAYLYTSPDDPSQMQAAHPGWEVDLERLGIYGEFVPYYVFETLSALFSGARSFVAPEAWEELCRRYYLRRTSRFYEINSLGREFPEWLREQPEGTPLAADVALFESSRHEIFIARGEVPREVEALSVNPTLATLQLGHHVTRWAKLAREAEDAGDGREVLPPEPGEELVLLWRHPETLLANYWTAKPRTLLALKIVLEGIPLSAAAEQGGIPEAEIRAVIAEATEQGLLLAPRG